MTGSSANQLYHSLIKVITYTAGVVILLWFLYKVAGSVLLLLFALILALVINAPVAWLEQKGLRRFWACIVVFGTILIFLFLLGWLIVPKISQQVTNLIINLPGYADQLSKNVATWFEDYPEINQEIQKQAVTLSQWIPSVPQTLMRIGNYSLSIVTMILIAVLFFSMVVYAVTNPRPLLQLYFSFFPASKQEKATRALQYTTTMLVGWIRANLIGGGIQAVLLTAFLSLLQVPGAWIWGALAFFSELIPKIGFYIMAVPPILVALSVSPATALWVTVFILILDELMADLVMPKIRSNTMNIHPVSILFIVLAMASAFGFLGALLATPLTAIIKAYYEEFFISRIKETNELNGRIDAVLYRYNEQQPPKT